ncbi:hypothetical protein [Moellerella wisconsensis]|uniref:Uncharacterized protein n=1 Tax=Moellerella wisconsensis ATCC 35017 TaxID=1354267 RepID=A0A0N1KIB1_9GAMM|nr:hypothetical protein [Moellerella wisconsensis]KPD02398.1 hypothetical protein M992_2110 [Moellerella wisconsensis ATCC 35017]VFS53757.1 Uncharacterised protein [Moellerella wisconsensis]
MNTLLDQLISELINVTKKYSENDDITVGIPQFTENNLKIQFHFADKNGLDITFNAIKSVENSL